MHNLEFYIDGAWVAPTKLKKLDVINPATEEAFAEIAMGSAEDVDKAVKAARRAFETFSVTGIGERKQLLESVLREYQKRIGDLSEAMSLEMGAPLEFSRASQAAMGTLHLRQMIKTLDTYSFSHQRGDTYVVREPIGVIGMITPWNWPMNQIVCKVAPAIAAGCTMVLKPSEISPLSGLIFAEIIHAAGVPVGIFNLVNGDGPGVGEAISAHPDIDMVSFTGSTRAGIMVAKAAADTIKRVHQELGGKSANILLKDADLEKAVTKGVAACFGNSGQSCNAPTRMFVHEDLHDQALTIAAKAAEDFVVGPPENSGTVLGPVVSATQYNKIQKLIEKGIEEGATLVAGGPGRPSNLNKGYYIRPTIFGHVTPDMTIAREEIFGPVLSILSYKDEEEAVWLANDTEYGLAAYIQTENPERAKAIARRMRAGTVYLNYPVWDSAAPFGGYKRSGNGREYADFALDDFTEIKGVVGWPAD